MEFPHLQRHLKAHGSEGLAVLTINPEDKPEQIKPFIEKEGYTFQVLFPKEGQARPEELYGVIANPTSYLIGPDGKILDVMVGIMLASPTDKNRLATDAEIDELPFFQEIRKALSEMRRTEGR